jgi:hypothetical protein
VPEKPTTIAIEPVMSIVFIMGPWSPPCHPGLESSALVP